MSKNLDSIVSKYIRQWLELSVSATLSSIVLSSSKFGLAFQLPSVKFQQCQTVLRSSLKSSKDEVIVRVWGNTNCGANIQYDNYFIPSCSFFKKSQFTLVLSSTSDCSSCLQPESLLHTIADCKTYLDQGHKSAFCFLAQTFQSVSSSKLYMDLPGSLSLRAITGDSLRPDMLLSTADKLYIIELIVGFETNLANNARRKELKYHSHVTDLSNDCHSIEFFSLSIHSFGIFGQSSVSFLKMCNKLSFDNFTISKLSTIAIHMTYCIFCTGNKPWCNPERLSY